MDINLGESNGRKEKFGRECFNLFKLRKRRTAGSLPEPPPGPMDRSQGLT